MTEVDPRHYRRMGGVLNGRDMKQVSDRGGGQLKIAMGVAVLATAVADGRCCSNQRPAVSRAHAAPTGHCVDVC